ncbi:hypothetical protein O181_083863 [Austropuccinia psidii MF-1]|uniref:Chromo domain-containing protein n=1 Tax=Austropuccinia psidii MF-1 TaxID=1389203 RepID=A0A9Q3IK01_9BASI|nr:hypothetical protein [Austropuccinia psidii MF-1]
MAFLQEHKINKNQQKSVRKVVGSFSNLKRSQYSCLPVQAPISMDVHTPVFHISLLEQFKTLSIPNKHKEPALPSIIKKEGEWEVSQMLDSQIKRGKLWYMVKWKGFSKDPERATWDQLKASSLFLNL